MREYYLLYYDTSLTHGIVEKVYAQSRPRHLPDLTLLYWELHWPCLTQEGHTIFMGFPLGVGGVGGVGGIILLGAQTNSVLSLMVNRQRY